MATVVQRYGQRQIATRQLPGVRRTAAETATSRGAGLANERARTAERTAQAAAQVASTALDWAGRLRQEEKQRADEVAMLEAENQLNEWESKYLFGDGSSSQGALGLQGKNAMGLPEQAGEEFEAIASTIEQNLTNPEQRAAFARVRSNRQQNLRMTIARHVNGEIQRYERTELDSYVANKTNEAIQNALDPRRSEQALVHLETAIRNHAPRLGLGAEAVDRQVEAAQSAVRVGVINRLLAGEHTAAAKAYFEETKGQISGEALDQIETAIRTGTVRKEAQDATETILAGGGTLTEQRQRAKDQYDGAVLDEVLRRLEHESAVNEADKRQKHETMLTGVFNQLDGMGARADVSAIDPATWATLTGAEKTAAYNYAEARVSGTPIQTDWSLWTRLMQDARTNPTRFSQASLFQYRGRLGDAEYKQLVGMQGSIAAGDRTGGGQLADFSTKKEVIDAALADYGVEPTDAERGRMYQLLDEQLAALGPDAKPSATDYRTMVDEILGSKTMVTEGWFDRLFGIQQEALIISDDLTIADIPIDTKRDLETNMRRRGIPVTPQSTLQQYRLFILNRNRRGQ